MATIRSFRIKRGEFIFLSRVSFLHSALALSVGTGGRYLEAIQSRVRREKSPNVLSKFIRQLMHKRIALKGVLKFTLKQLQHVSV